jgi:hypothetical protein
LNLDIIFGHPFYFFPMSAFSTNKSVTLQPQNTADAGIGTETERRFLIGLNCDWTVKADLEIGAPVSPFNPARPFYPHYHRCSEFQS